MSAKFQRLWRAGTAFGLFSSLFLALGAVAAPPASAKEAPEPTTTLAPCPVPYAPGSTACHGSLSPNGSPLLKPGDDKPSGNINRITATERACKVTAKGVCIDHAQILAQGFGWYALVAAMAGICISAASWAIGSQTQNSQQQLIGKKGFIICCTAAFFVGSVTQLMSWLENQAAQMDETGVTRKG
jgi:hypothetical protein